MTHPRIWCDYNAENEQGDFLLDGSGTQDSLASRGLALRAGLRVTLSMEDPDDDGRAALLRVDAVVVVGEGGALVAGVEPDTWRREPIAPA